MGIVLKMTHLLCFLTLLGVASAFSVKALRTSSIALRPARTVTWSTKEVSDTSQASLVELKEKLLRSVAGANRGLNSLVQERKDIQRIVEQLEERNPNAAPNSGLEDGSSLLAGDWKLLFTSALDVLSLGLIPGVDVGQVYQNISEDGKEIVNVVDLQPKGSPLFSRYAGETSARIKVVAASEVEGDKRVNLVFRRSIYRPLSLFGRDVSKTLPQLTFNLPQLPTAGWIDTTYLDEDLRVARAFGGNLFVLERV